VLPTGYSTHLTVESLSVSLRNDSLYPGIRRFGDMIQIENETEGMPRCVVRSQSGTFWPDMLKLEAAMMAQAPKVSV